MRKLICTGTIFAVMLMAQPANTPDGTTYEGACLHWEKGEFVMKMRPCDYPTHDWAWKNTDSYYGLGAVGDVWVDPNMRVAKTPEQKLAEQLESVTKQRDDYWRWLGICATALAGLIFAGVVVTRKLHSTYYPVEFHRGWVAGVNYGRGRSEK